MEPGAVDTACAELAELLQHRTLAVLTGAGISTESGIPDYRGPGTRQRARNPIQYREFVRDEQARRRYWARSTLGWQRVSASLPNAAHRALADLERAGVVAGVITQNVDRLHQRAGSQRVVELHGALEEVVCLDCGCLEARPGLQQRLLALNPGWDERYAEQAPDGDAELSPGLVNGFRVAACLRCRGTLKPNVVFFGESVPRCVVDEAWQVLHGADALLVIGTSLAVYSGFRFVRRAAERAMPIAVINIGPIRGGELAGVHVEARAGDAVPRLTAALLNRAA